MTQPTASDICGIAILAKGECVLRVGIAKEASADGLFRDKAWLAESRKRRLTAVKIDGAEYMAITASLSDVDIVILSEGAGAAVLDFYCSVHFAHDVINHLLTDPFNAMTIVDDAGRLVYISPVHEYFFGLKRGEARGRPLQDVIENTRLDHVVKSGKAEVGFLQKMRGVERIVSRVPIKRDGKTLGAIGRILFRGPQQVDELSQRIRSLENELEFYRREASALRKGNAQLEIVGESPAIRKLRSQIERIAPLETPVLIRGESGTGKELVAHALHFLSSRRDGSFVAVNAARISATFVEPELFGYEPGAFAGADRYGGKGKLEQANGGTFLLDEIGDMPLDVQPKLLRVLEDRMVERIGSGEPREVNFRLIVSSNRDLQTLIEAGQFRLDLYYRVSPLVIDVPPLRQRLSDIPLLALHFLKEIAYRLARPIPTISDDALVFLMDQAWPGNVRQLRNELEHAFLFVENDVIVPENFSRFEQAQRRNAVVANVLPAESAARTSSLRDAVGEVEERQIRIAMGKFAGNKRKVASQLGISRSYLYKKLTIMQNREVETM